MNPEPGGRHGPRSGAHPTARRHSLVQADSRRAFLRGAGLAGAVSLAGPILKFIETIFGLPALASINHRFDTATPGGPNNEAAGGSPSGPPAPPRDGRTDIGNLLECFSF